MLRCPASGYEIQAPEFKQARAARKHPRYDLMIFADLSGGIPAQQIRLEPDPDAPEMPGLELSAEAIAAGPFQPGADPEWYACPPEERARIRAAIEAAGKAGLDVLSAVLRGAEPAAGFPKAAPENVTAADPAPDAAPEDVSGDAQEDFAETAAPASPAAQPRVGKPATGRRKGN